MHPLQQASGILFADIVGSSQLYEDLGNIDAERAISQALETLKTICRAHQGLIIKTIGDELMCRFEEPQYLLAAAVAMQEAFTHANASHPAPAKSVHSIRIGCHIGEVIVKENDVFGDSVNIAARLVEFARSGQIITSASTWSLFEKARPKINSRALRPLRIKGRLSSLAINEVLWQKDDLDLTRLLTLPQAHSGAHLWSVNLVYFGVTVQLNQDRSSITLGRASGCGLPVCTPMASRVHAKISATATQFVLLDQSTNGTFIQPDGQEEFQIHRHSQPLSGSGIISLGLPAASAPEHTIHYQFFAGSNKG